MRTSCRPIVGNSPSWTAKTYLSKIARKKIGIEIPISDATRLAVVDGAPVALGGDEAERDAERRWRRSSPPARARPSPGTVRPISSVTGRREEMLVPSSPWARLWRYCRYCSQIGRSRPYVRSICSIASGVARSPRSDSAGPPGRALIQRKTRIESPRRIGTSRSSRRTTKRSIRLVVRRLPTNVLPSLFCLGLLGLLFLVAETRPLRTPHRRRRPGSGTKPVTVLRKARAAVACTYGTPGMFAMISRLACS